MEKLLYNYQDERLNVETAAQGKLKLVAGADSLSLLALSRDNEVLALKAVGLAEKKPENHLFESELPETLSGLEVLKLPFAERQCAVSNGLFTMVPDRLFFREELPKYFHLLYDLNKTEATYDFEAFPEFGFHLIWAEESHFQCLKPRFKPKHLAISLIRAFQPLADPKERSVFLNLRGKQAQILVFDGGNLLFFNAFDFVKPVDLLYFVLLAFDQFKLNPEGHTLHCTGALLEGSEEYKMLYRYIRQIQFVGPKTAYSLPNGPESLPQHFWFDLISL